VWVPKSAKRTNALGAVLPRSLSEGMARALKADRVLMGADSNSRRAYELRASRSEPGLEAAPKQPQIASSAESTLPETVSVAGEPVGDQSAD